MISHTQVIKGVRRKKTKSALDPLSIKRSQRRIGRHDANQASDPPEAKRPWNDKSVGICFGSGQTRFSSVGTKPLIGVSNHTAAREVASKRPQVTKIFETKLPQGGLTLVPPWNLKSIQDTTGHSLQLLHFRYSPFQ